MTATTTQPGLWRRIWAFLQAMEMSSADFQYDRIDTLQRRVVALEQAPRDRAPNQS